MGNTLPVTCATMQFGLIMGTGRVLSEPYAAQLMAGCSNLAWKALTPNRQRYWLERVRDILECASFRAHIYDDEGSPCRRWAMCGVMIEEAIDGEVATEG